MNNQYSDGDMRTGKDEGGLPTSSNARESRSEQFFRKLNEAKVGQWLYLSFINRD